MAEVFRTNIEDRNHANMLIDQIHKTFIHYKANFDLEDCDNILRVECMRGQIESTKLILHLKNMDVMPKFYRMKFNH